MTKQFLEVVRTKKMPTLNKDHMTYMWCQPPDDILLVTYVYKEESELALTYIRTHLLS